MIDIHAHVTDDLNERLAVDAGLGIEVTILQATRVHPERARTVAEVRAEFATLQRVVAGDPAAGSFEDAAAELRRAVESAPGRTTAMAAVPLWLEPSAMAEATDAQLQHPAYVGIGELTPPPGSAAVIEPVLKLSADHGGVRSSSMGSHPTPTTTCAATPTWRAHTRACP